MYKLILITLIALIGYCQSLLHPASSSLGLVASVSVPIPELLPDRRLLVDWCFQMSYDLPNQLSSFYNIPIWPGKHSPKTRKRDTHQWSVDNQWESLRTYNTSPAMGRHPSDFSAGELYHGIEDLLVSYNFHESCLLQSVCELARHPFEEDNRNVLTDIITFILTPSQHEGFDASELLYRDTYEEAERSGFLGEDCASIYPECQTDLLMLITNTKSVF